MRVAKVVSRPAKTDQLRYHPLNDSDSPRGTVGQWRGWFLAQDCDGLLDEARTEASGPVSDEDFGRVIV